MFFQHTVTLSPRRRGCHLITDEILKPIQGDLAKIKIGLASFFIQHTSARFTIKRSLTINENADPDVRRDMETMMNRIVPEGTQFKYTHDAEGPDDMPAHVKASLMGPSLTVPISRGSLALGTWQGIWLNEHRDHGGSRRVVVTIHGE